MLPIYKWPCEKEGNKIFEKYFSEYVKQKWIPIYWTILQAGH